MFELYKQQIIVGIFFLAVLPACGQSLTSEIKSIVAGQPAKVGVSIIGSDTDEIFNIHEDEHFPMQSVFKFHIGMTFLSEVGEGKFSLNNKISIRKEDLMTNTWSPMRDAHPTGGDLSLKEILRFTVSESDNNGCDILLKILGGPAVVEHFVHELGVKDIAIVASERDMHQSWEVQFTNWTTPRAATALLQKFYRHQGLTNENFEVLWKMMADSPTGANRLKKRLPADAVVAHKTGTSGSKDGIMAAINDIGIIKLPNGKYFTIAVFVTDSKLDLDAAEQLIADISWAAWQHFSRVK